MINTVSKKYSGVILDQSADHTHSVALTEINGYNVYQEFTLPTNLIRGSTTSDAKIPPLTGFQVLAQVDPGWEDTATIDWIIQRFVVGTGWVDVTDGRVIGATQSGVTWITAYFDDLLYIPEVELTDRFRFGVRGRDTTSDTFKREVSYMNGEAIIDGMPVSVRLIPGVPHHLVFHASQSVLQQDIHTNRVYFSTERGAASLYLTSPNPLATAGVKAFTSDGTTPLHPDGVDCSLNFRILAGTAEEGTDFLGNQYRSVMIQTKVEDASTEDGLAIDKYWLSKPNPSKFAVESLYFDISDYRGEPQTVDHVLIDPITPGVFFNVYWSSEGDPVEFPHDWDDKLWERVPDVFQAKAKFSHALPQPITARYLKIEFSHLQPRWYAPGNFQKPISYRKHPKWVLDYFLLRIQEARTSDDPFVARSVSLDYSAYDLAYNYYLDDLSQQPLSPSQLGAHDLSELSAYLGSSSNAADEVDSQTFSKISAVFQPFTLEPGVKVAADSILSQYTVGASTALRSGERVIPLTSPTEGDPLPFTINNQVSSINREALIIENSLPVMYFFIPCRHRYKLLSAKFPNDKAYFAGVNEIAFLRDRYAVAHDDTLYVESAGDLTNVERNDFVTDGQVWTTSA